MSYDKQNWQTGDVITANKLNHIEDGIAGAGGGGMLVISAVYDEQTDTTTLDKTWQEIHDATFAVIVLASPIGTNYEHIGVIGQRPGEYYVTSGFLSTDEVQSSIFVCDSADGYPVLHTD